MKSIFSSRRNKSPHNNEEMERHTAPFFGKEHKVPFFNTSGGVAVQTKLKVGQPGDKYEKEADHMADAVVNGSSKPEVQNKEISNIQRESLATPQEDEKLGTAEQRMEEDKLIQEKPELQKMEEEEEGIVSKMEGEEEEEMQMKTEEEEEGMVNTMEGEEEEEGSLQTTRVGGTTTTAGPGITQKIKSKSGRGKALPKKTRAEMESSFGRDFSDVNIHTDRDAVIMNKQLGAQAFTHGRDIYFNSGKYNPETNQGKRLLAHELTHTIQQAGGAKKSDKADIQRYGGCSTTQDASIDADVSRALGWINGAIANLFSYDGTTPAKVHTALDTHFNGSTSRSFGYWVMTNLIYLRGVAWMAGYQCETTGGSFWACTGPNTEATTFWCVPGVDIRLCPPYFSNSSSGRSTTLVHEWVHKYGCNFDMGYEHEPGYAGNGTLKQLLNADSFAHFVQDAH